MEYGQEEPGGGGEKYFPWEMNTKCGIEVRVGSGQAVRSWQLYERSDLVEAEGPVCEM